MRDYSLNTEQIVSFLSFLECCVSLEGYFSGTGSHGAFFQNQMARKNTVIVIEHNVDVMRCSDWLIDLGPEGDERSGYILATGTQEEVAALEGNETGNFLRTIGNVIE